MKISEIKSLTRSTMLCGQSKLDENVKSACAGDLMSDMLAFGGEESVLITGLVNQHVIHTAEMLDVKLVIFARGKIPTQEILDLAQEKDIAVMYTNTTLFGCCGILYANGLNVE